MSLWLCTVCRTLTGPTNAPCPKCGGAVEYATLPNTPAPPPEERAPIYGVRECRGHWHVINIAADEDVSVAMNEDDARDLAAHYNDGDFAPLTPPSADATAGERKGILTPQEYAIQEEWKAAYEELAAECARLREALEAIRHDSFDDGARDLAAMAIGMIRCASEEGWCWPDSAEAAASRPSRKPR